MTNDHNAHPTQSRRSWLRSAATLMGGTIVGCLSPMAWPRRAPSATVVGPAEFPSQNTLPDPAIRTWFIVYTRSPALFAEAGTPIDCGELYRVTNADTFLGYAPGTLRIRLVAAYRLVDDGKVRYELNERWHLNRSHDVRYDKAEYMIQRRLQGEWSAPRISFGDWIGPYFTVSTLTGDERPTGDHHGHR